MCLAVQFLSPKCLSMFARHEERWSNMSGWYFRIFLLIFVYFMKEKVVELLGRKKTEKLKGVL